jgi:hypothetical protein
MHRIRKGQLVGGANVPFRAQNWGLAQMCGLVAETFIEGTSSSSDSFCNITALGPALISTTGHTPEAERVYTRARALCQQVGDTHQLFPVLWGLRYVYQVRGQSQRAYEVGKELLGVAQ